jgi:hypothetical protein
MRNDELDLHRDAKPAQLAHIQRVLVMIDTAIERGQIERADEPRLLLMGLRNVLMLKGYLGAMPPGRCAPLLAAEQRVFAARNLNRNLVNGEYASASGGGGAPAESQSPLDPGRSRDLQPSTGASAAPGKGVDSGGIHAEENGHATTVKQPYSATNIPDVFDTPSLPEPAPKPTAEAIKNLEVNRARLADEARHLAGNDLGRLRAIEKAIKGDQAAWEKAKKDPIAFQIIQAVAGEGVFVRAQVVNQLVGMDAFNGGTKKNPEVPWRVKRLVVLVLGNAFEENSRQAFDRLSEDMQTNARWRGAPITRMSLLSQRVGETPYFPLTPKDAREEAPAIRLAIAANGLGPREYTMGKHLFFKRYGRGIAKLSADVGVPEDLMLGLGAREGGWFDIHNFRDNNVFGVTHAGGVNQTSAALSLTFTSWRDNFGSSVSDNGYPSQYDEVRAKKKADQRKFARPPIADIVPGKPLPKGLEMGEAGRIATPADRVTEFAERLKNLDKGQLPHSERQMYNWDHENLYSRGQRRHIPNEPSGPGAPSYHDWSNGLRQFTQGASKAWSVFARASRSIASSPPR